MRIGFASDIHVLRYGNKLILGGVNIPSQMGEVAHSDGDVVFHALSEAILGALALGDLGDHFPDNDPTTLGLNSAHIFRYVLNKMDEHNYEIGNIDISIYLESPKLKNYKDSMRANIAYLANIDISQVSIKACTNEKLDSIGQGLAVKADAIVLLKEKEKENEK